MGLFGSKKQETPVYVEQPKPEGTVIGEGITFVGTFTADELIDIRGKVEGEIISPVEVLVSKTGKHEGTMDVVYLTVDGTIDSEIHCRNTVTLRDDCQVFGTVNTPRLDAQDGSNFHGTLNLEKDIELEAAEKAAQSDAEIEVIKAVNVEVSEDVEEDSQLDASGEVIKEEIVEAAEEAVEPEESEEPVMEEAPVEAAVEEAPVEAVIGEEPATVEEPTIELPTMEEVLEVKDFKDLEDMVEEQVWESAKKAQEAVHPAESTENLVEFME